MYNNIHVTIVFIKGCPPQCAASLNTTHTGTTAPCQSGYIPLPNGDLEPTGFGGVTTALAVLPVLCTRQNNNIVCIRTR